MAFTVPYDCINLPMAYFCASVDNVRPFINTTPFYTLILTSPFAMRFTSKSLWYIEKRQGQLSSPEHIIKCLSTGYLLCIEQIATPGIPNASI